ncbi:MAG TPA: hypothetical protein VGN83_23685 [Falsiroseomonas sp.]|jgi:hypothetical protein|nr:hypothetical protein [Falsiroseomonas sp.]
MISFPLFERLQVIGYGLYPGKLPERSGLTVEFMPGLTLVLGANGLGKTTLVTIIYRLLTGPYDIPALAGRGDLGSGNIGARSLSAAGAAIFAARVSDRARDARASLTFSMGRHRVTVERRLCDMSLVRFIVDDMPIGLDEASNFQARICELAGVGQFGDWILLLRHLVFYFEDRRALVWDPSAQTQLLRLLALPASVAAEWTRLEREVLELDSRSRNLSAALFREERDFSRVEAKLGNGRDVARQLETLGKLQAADEERLAEIGDDRADLESQREAARLRFLLAEQAREGEYREHERARLSAIAARFPSRSETARFILAQLMTENECIVCGSASPVAAKGYTDRMEAGCCVVCATPLPSDDLVVPERGLADRRVEEATARLRRADLEMAAAQEALEAADKGYSARIEDIQRLTTDLAERSRKMDELLRILPESETELLLQRTEIAGLRARLAAQREDLAKKRSTFQAYVDDKSKAVTNLAEAIKAAFSEFASQFLYERSVLVWSPRRASVGQGGSQIDFPAFELDLSGTDFQGAMAETG